MKFISLLFFSILFSTNVFSQLIINQAYLKNFEYKIYQDSTAHTNILPYDPALSIDTASCGKTNIAFSPVIYLSSLFNINTKSFSNLYYGGVKFHFHHYDKFILNLSSYYGTYKPLNFEIEKIDTLNIIPSYGLIRKKLANQNLFGGFVGSFTYRPQNYIWFELGNDKTFFGDGYRSLLLSDFSQPYPYFKTTVEVWKAKYVYMISKMHDYDFKYSQSRLDLQPKYIFTHYLSFNFLKRLNFSMFETVVTSTRDSIGAHRGLDVNYLNPVIFFRSVEMSLGSPDNVLVGFTGHLKLFKSTMLYGQIFIDEFILSHIKSSTEYWDEKYGIQAGYKCYNTFGIKNLYSQIEFNAIRPYTYSHLNPIRAYTNTFQPLAHPLGSNFVESLGIVSYTYKNYFAEIKTVFSVWGDSDSLNYGHNPLLSYQTRVADEGINWLNGTKNSLKFISFTAGIKKWDLIISSTIFYRQTEDIKNNSNIYFSFNFGKALFSSYYDY